jgi:hypothetical protein
MVELRIPGDKIFLLEEGELDAASWLVFLGGHCHSLALALNARTGWPLVAIIGASDDCVHVAVRSPADRIVDITGAHSPSDMIKPSMAADKSAQSTRTTSIASLKRTAGQNRLHLWPPLGSILF